jgi:hypothetical protein
MPNVTTVNSIADLKLISGPSNDDSVLLLGYWSPGDGGGGTFIFNSSSSDPYNDGTIIAPSTGTGRWERMVEGVINVRWFGAKGDLTTPDTAAIQNAINASYSTNVTAIYFPDGNYVVDGQIFLYGKTSLFGNSGKSVIRFEGTFGGSVVNKYVFVLGISAKNVINTWTNAYISNLSFVGNPNAQFSYAINTFNVNNVRFENLLFNWTNIDKGAGYGTSIEGLNDAAYSAGPSREFVKIINCEVIHKQDSVGAEGLGQTNCTGLEISGCKIYGVADDSIGIHHCENVVVANNECYSTDGRIYISNSTNVLIEGNYVERIQQQVSGGWIVGGALIMVDMEDADPSSNIKVVNNTFVLPAGMTGANSTYMARFLGVRGLTCCGNIFECNSNVAVSIINIQPKVLGAATLYPVDHVISDNIAKGDYPAPIRENASLATDIVGPIFYSNNNAQYSLIGNKSFIVGQLFGNGAPETVLSAPVGSLYSDKSNGSNNLWLKLTGNGNTGWTQLAILNGSNTFTANQNFSPNLNGSASISTTNSNPGAAADTRTRTSNGTTTLDIIVRGTGYTGTPNAGIISLSGANPLSFYNSGAEKARLLGNGNWIFQNSGTYLDNGNLLQVAGNVSAKQIIGSSSAPTVSAGTGAGTAAIVAISGTNLGGIITITTGTSPIASATVITITYSGSGYNLESYPIISPANSYASALSGNSQVYVAGSATTFIIVSGSSPLLSSTQYIWNYLITGKV